MSDLLDLAVKAHGGLERWNAFQGVAVDVSVGGALWAFKGQPGLFKDSRYEAQTRVQQATIHRVGSPDRLVRFTPQRLSLESESGEVIESRNDPRAAFQGHQNETPWDLLHAVYFNSYALWTYLNQPFLYTWPGFVTEELEPWNENGETWRRLKVTFPDSVASHTREQVTYFDADGLMRRHDYAVDVLGGTVGAQYIHDYTEANGLMVPARRHIFPLGAGNRPVPEPLLVSIDIVAVQFS
ncbi:hypothetical protein [Paraburkholderia aspalathi]|uniref:Uncharacterized protein n=1 Tax=Paraburkholderia aspalathi TaxID=1324617 RepID=A0A1I7ERN6_9BURK|nr:hypothetical protein [Paraburkholderia aspalathi]SFU26591.1 hypothetical protein SAMN05192563_10607 [Paraburkholderia aspalathi]